jgi:hypothetical protein
MKRTGRPRTRFDRLQKSANSNVAAHVSKKATCRAACPALARSSTAAATGPESRGAAGTACAFSSGTAGDAARSPRAGGEAPCVSDM